MAEGGALPELENGVLPIFYEPPRDMQVTDSLEILFTRDFITHVIRRTIPDWTFGRQFATPCPCTPFSFRIRQAVDFYLVKESVSLHFLIRYAFMDQPLTFEGFVKAVNIAVESIFSEITEANELLRLICVYAAYTTKAAKLGIYMAPFFALVHIQYLLAIFIRRIEKPAEYFFGHLGYNSEKLIHEDARITFADDD